MAGRRDRPERLRLRLRGWTRRHAHPLRRVLYYVYLPAWFLYHDPLLAAVADDCCGGEFPAWTAIIRWPVTHHWVNAHPIGEAILIAPFFAVAHALTRWTNLSPDGFSPYYQHAAGLAGLFYVLAGLWFLRRLLGRHFSPGVVDASLAALLLGTSLLHYGTFDSVWSHAFSFALCAGLLERLDAWQPGSTRDDVLIGVLAALMILVRHTNLLVPLFFVAAVRSPRLALTAGRSRRWACCRSCGCITAPPATGWSARTDRSGSRSRRRICGACSAASRKGAFFWAPLLLIAVAGFAWLPVSLRRWRAPAAALLAVHTYIIASWWDWQFGASYGHRGFVDVYPILALGLGVGVRPRFCGAVAARRLDGRRRDALRAVGVPDAAGTGTASCRWPTRPGRNTARRSCGAGGDAKKSGHPPARRDGGLRPLVPSRSPVADSSNDGAARGRAGARRHDLPLERRARLVLRCGGRRRHPPAACDHVRCRGRRAHGRHRVRGRCAAPRGSFSWTTPGAP